MPFFLWSESPYILLASAELQLPIARCQFLILHGYLALKLGWSLHCRGFVSFTGGLRLLLLLFCTLLLFGICPCFYGDRLAGLFASRYTTTACVRIGTIDIRMRRSVVSTHRAFIQLVALGVDDTRPRLVSRLYKIENHQRAGEGALLTSKLTLPFSASTCASSRRFPLASLYSTRSALSTTTPFGKSSRPFGRGGCCGCCGGGGGGGGGGGCCGASRGVTAAGSGDDSTTCPGAWEDGIFESTDESRAY
jgi:hypothetical protein